MKQKTKKKVKVAIYNPDTLLCPITGMKPSRDRRVGKKECI